MKKVFITTLPVMIVYIFLGIYYGIYMEQSGFGPIWSFFTSLFVFAGAAQYALVPLLVSNASPFVVFTLVLILNARHIFYGITMLPKYSDVTKGKMYLMQGLTDETFGILYPIDKSSLNHPRLFYFQVTLLNHFYWVAGSTIGAILSSAFSIQIIGLDFILVALFVAIFVSQLKKRENRVPGFIGIGITIVSRVLFSSSFVIVSMIGIIVALVVLDQRRGVRTNE